MKIEINITKKKFYLIFTIVSIFSLIAAAIAYNTNNPGYLGHSPGEIDFTVGSESNIRILGSRNGIIFPDNTIQSTASAPLSSLDCKTYGYGTRNEKGQCPNQGMVYFGHIGEHVNGIKCDQTVTANNFNNVHVCNICCTPISTGKSEEGDGFVQTTAASSTRTKPNTPIGDLCEYITRSSGVGDAKYCQVTQNRIAGLPSTTTCYFDADPNKLNNLCTSQLECKLGSIISSFDKTSIYEVCVSGV